MNSTFKSFQISFVICVMPELHGNIKTITGTFDFTIDPSSFLHHFQTLDKLLIRS